MISRGDAEIIARLPVHGGVIPHELVLQASHQIDYDQAWLLSGARLVVTGTDSECTEAEFDAAITGAHVATSLLSFC